VINDVENIKGKVKKRKKREMKARIESQDSERAAFALLKSGARKIRAAHFNPGFC
jgi:hypothetical protein